LKQGLEFGSSIIFASFASFVQSSSPLQILYQAVNHDTNSHEGNWRNFLPRVCTSKMDDSHFAADYMEVRPLKLATGWILIITKDGATNNCLDEASPNNCVVEKSTLSMTVKEGLGPSSFAMDILRHS
jgi:hypothetical protein